MKRISKRTVKTIILQLTNHNKHTIEWTNQNSKPKKQYNPSNLQNAGKHAQASLGRVYVIELMNGRGISIISLIG